MSDSYQYRNETGHAHTLTHERALFQVIEAARQKNVPIVLDAVSSTRVFESLGVPNSPTLSCLSVHLQRVVCLAVTSGHAHIHIISHHLARSVLIGCTVSRVTTTRSCAWVWPCCADAQRNRVSTALARSHGYARTHAFQHIGRNRGAVERAGRCDDSPQGLQ